MCAKLKQVYHLLRNALIRAWVICVASLTRMEDRRPTIPEVVEPDREGIIMVTRDDEAVVVEMTDVMSIEKYNKNYKMSENYKKIEKSSSQVNFFIIIFVVFVAFLSFSVTSIIVLCCLVINVYVWRLVEYNRVFSVPMLFVDPDVCVVMYENVYVTTDYILLLVLFCSNACTENMYQYDVKHFSFKMLALILSPMINIWVFIFVAIALFFYARMPIYPALVDRLEYLNLCKRCLTSLSH